MKITNGKSFYFLNEKSTRGAIQAYIGSFCYLAIVSNSKVWNALSYNGVSPVIGFIGFGLALQADTGGNAIYVIVRVLATSCGGAVGLLILYLVYWCNGSSFDETVTKGVMFVIFICIALSTLAYHFRGPPWSAKYKGVLIAGNTLIFVSTIGYWQETLLPKIFAYIILNMLMGLFIASIVSHLILPITQGDTVVSLINGTVLLLSQAITAAASEVKRKGSDVVPDLMNDYIIPTGDMIMKCKLMLQGSVSTEVDIRSWPFRRFPVRTYMYLLKISRQFLSIYGTLVDLIRSSDHFWDEHVQKDTIFFVDRLAKEIHESLAFFVEFTSSSPDAVTYERGLARAKELKDVLTLVSNFLNTAYPEDSRARISGSSRAVLTTFWMLGLQTADYYLIMIEVRSSSYHGKNHSVSQHQKSFKDIFTSIKNDLVPKKCPEQGEEDWQHSSGSSWQGKANAFKPEEHSFKHHRGDYFSISLRKCIHLLHLKPLYLKHVLQQGIATGIAATLVVCSKSHAAFSEHADWILITVWVMGAQSTIGAVALKSVNRVLGTIFAGILSYMIIYLVFLLNGLSYVNRAPKYIFMTLLYPAALSFFQKCMLQASPEYQYAWYVMKLTLPIVVLSGYNEDSPNPETAAWRILCILIGLCIEFIIKSLIYYRESATSARHEIQKMCKRMASLSTDSIHVPLEHSQQYFIYTPTHANGIEAAKCLSNLIKLQSFLSFEDKVEKYLLGLKIFERKLINTTSLPDIRHHLRVVLNRILTITYLKNGMFVLDMEYDSIDRFMKLELSDMLSTQIPTCLMEISALFGPRRSTGNGFCILADECTQRIKALEANVSDLFEKFSEICGNAGKRDVAYSESETVALAYVNILSSLVKALAELLRCILEYATIDTSDSISIDYDI